MTRPEISEIKPEMPSTGVKNLSEMTIGENEMSIDANDMRRANQCVCPLPGKCPWCDKNNHVG